MQPNIKKVGIANDVVCGSRVTLVEPLNLYGCVLGDDVFVGPFTEIQKGVAIGARTRVQSHCFICDMVRIGSDCFISHGVMFINDTFSIGRRAMGDASLYKATVIEDGVTIGTGAVIMPVRIASGAVIGAGAVVTKDILEPGCYVGNPARRLIKE